MRPKGSSVDLEHRRRMAVSLVRKGTRIRDVAGLFKIHVSSVRRWMRAEREKGYHGLSAISNCKGPSKLTRDQEETVCRWLQQHPREVGFSAAHWTAQHIAEAIEQGFGVRFHPKYVYFWLRRRGIKPQALRNDHRAAGSEILHRSRALSATDAATPDLKMYQVGRTDGGNSLSVVKTATEEI